MDRRRYLAQASGHSPRAGGRAVGLDHVVQGRARRTLRNVYEADHAAAHHGGRFRWLISTCLAGAVGAVALVVVIVGSTDPKTSSDGLLPALKRLQDGAAPALILPQVQKAAGLNWTLPKSDRLEIISGAVTTRSIVHESLKQQRDGRTYIQARPYIKIAAKLGPVPDNYLDVIPAFNPFKLYADENPIGRNAKSGKGSDTSDVDVKVVELLGGILPNEDGQELATNEVVDIINSARQQARRDWQLSNSGDASGANGANGAGPLTGFDAASQTNTTVLEKSVIESDDVVSDFEGGRKVILKAGDNDTLRDLLLRQGSQPWIIDGLLEAAQTMWPNQALTYGQEVHLTMVPSLTDADKMEPVRMSLFSFAHTHIVTVWRNAAGDFEASAEPLKSEADETEKAKTTKSKGNSLYASVYYACLLQNIPPAQIMQILKTHAYETDFGRRVRPGDNIEFFFDLRDGKDTEGPPGQLMYTRITAGGETSKFYRFRASDGEWDYFSENGNNSRRFLMRKPVRGSNVRFTSGFGMRNHPLLNRRRMHNGVDWAAPRGTPILAAGKGTITYAGRKGASGNYVRIRHANGYQSSYSHMHRFAPGVKTGVRVRQGQVIGYIGNTGLSSGPHLHFEVLVKKRPVDPMKIKVGKERQLDGEDLRRFIRQRARIDDLMRRQPVKTSSR